MSDRQSAQQKSLSPSGLGGIVLAEAIPIAWWSHIVRVNDTMSLLLFLVVVIALALFATVVGAVVAMAGRKGPPSPPRNPKIHIKLL